MCYTHACACQSSSDLQVGVVHSLELSIIRYPLNPWDLHNLLLTSVCRHRGTYLTCRPAIALIWTCAVGKSVGCVLVAKGCVGCRFMQWRHNLCGWRHIGGIVTYVVVCHLGGETSDVVVGHRCCAITNVTLSQMLPCHIGCYRSPSWRCHLGCGDHIGGGGTEMAPSHK